MSSGGTSTGILYGLVYRVRVRCQTPSRHGGDALLQINGVVGRTNSSDVSVWDGGCGSDEGCSSGFCRHAGSDQARVYELVGQGIGTAVVVVAVANYMR